MLPTQKQLSSACEEAAEQISLAIQLTNVVDTSRIADLIYQYMRELLQEE